MKIKQLLIGLYIRFHGSDFFLNRAIKQARKLHLTSSNNPHYRKRYRVFFLKNRYRVISRDNIQMRKHSKEYGWHVNSTNMQPLCFFDTNM
jgi:hypothetical protein